MPTLDELYVFQAAIEKWGPEKQIDKAIEECGELIVALSHYKQGREADVCTEIVDVSIMISQLTLIFNTKEVIDTYDKKVNRLAARINEK